MSIASLTISILVAIAVVYRGFIHDWFFKPNLEVTFSLDEPISRETIVLWPPWALEPAQRKSAFWPRLKVTNAGRGTARRCEGILAEVRDCDGNLVKKYDPLKLRWAIAPINKGLEPLDIARDRQVDLNIFTTFKDVSNADFATYPDAVGVPLFLEPGDYWLRIVIYGDNFKPVGRGYAVQWDGKDYKGVKMQEMSKMPNSTSHWPWSTLAKTESKHLS